MSNIQTGDKVTFTARGKQHKGVVVRVRLAAARGYKKALADFFSPGSLDRVKAEVQTTDGRLWTVVTSHLTITGKAKQAEVTAAAEDAHDLKAAIRNQRAQRQAEQAAVATSSGVAGLKSGDCCFVLFKGRKVREQVIFRGIVPSSGNVRFEQRGRIRTTPARFVFATAE